MKFMKKGGMLLMVIAVLVSMFMLTGCLNYKSYQPKDTSKNSDLIKEIAEIEKELGLASNKTTETTTKTTTGTAKNTTTSKITGAAVGVKNDTK